MSALPAVYPGQFVSARNKRITATRSNTPDYADDMARIAEGVFQGPPATFRDLLKLFTRLTAAPGGDFYEGVNHVKVDSGESPFAKLDESVAESSASEIALSIGEFGETAVGREVFGEGEIKRYAGSDGAGSKFDLFDDIYRFVFFPESVVGAERWAGFSDDYKAYLRLDALVSLYCLAGRIGSTPYDRGSGSLINLMLHAGIARVREDYPGLEIPYVFNRPGENFVLTPFSSGVSFREAHGALSSWIRYDDAGGRLGFNLVRYDGSRGDDPFVFEGVPSAVNIIAMNQDDAVEASAYTIKTYQEEGLPEQARGEEGPFIKASDLIDPEFK